MKISKADRSPLIVASVIMFIGLSLLLVGFIAACKGSQGTPAKINTEDSRPFVNGEILAPDYAHSDSLIVINASELNGIFDGVDVSILPTTDSEINDVLHKYCSKVRPADTEYHFNVDMTGYDIYNSDMQLIGRINYGSNPTLDSLIDFDNQ